MSTDTTAYLLNTDFDRYDFLAFLDSKGIDFTHEYDNTPFGGYRGGNVSVTYNDTLMSIFILDGPQTDILDKNILDEVDGLEIDESKKFIYFSMSQHEFAINFLKEVLLGMGEGVLIENDCKLGEIPPYIVKADEFGNFIRPTVVTVKEIIRFYREQNNIKGKIFISK